MAIDFYAYNTPNGRKISVALEEMELPYNVHVVNILNGEQHDPAFLKLSPNNKIPAIVEPERPGRDADQRVRVGRDLDLSRRANRPVLAARPACARSRA
jgi:GSH-dependent disulfide-bond oxidoreductase